MSSIQMNAEELYKKCCAYMLWTEIAFRYEQAMILKKIKESKGWFNRQKYKTYDEAREALSKKSLYDVDWRFKYYSFLFTPYKDNRDKVRKLILLSQNGNPVIVTAEDSFVLNLTYTKELANLGITVEKAVEIYEENN